VRFFTPFCLMRFLGVWQIARAFQRFFVEHVGRIICSAVPVCVCVCVCVCVWRSVVVFYGGRLLWVFGGCPWLHFERGVSRRGQPFPDAPRGGGNQELTKS
jgi:hypothetical protein